MTFENVSDLKMERYLVGELPESEMATLRRREAEDEIFAARVRKMREDGKRFLAENPFAALETKMNESGSAGDRVPLQGHNSDVYARSNTLWLKVAAALVVALGIFAAVFVNRDVTTVENVGTAPGMNVAMVEGLDDGVRIKGMEAGLEVWKKTGDSAVQMENLAEAREGDEIQLRYRVPQKCYGMLFSMDGNGTVTMHVGEGNRAVELSSGKMTSLPFAYKLDNAPKFEKFFLLTSGESFEIDVNDIDKVLKQKNVESVSFTLRKAER